MIPGGDRLAERVPSSTDRFLRFLADRGARCTFFTTGDVARRYPSLVRDIAEQGHEVACHSSDHASLHEHDPESFRADVLRCQEDFGSAGVPPAVGFRAPCGSLTRKTAWAYDVLSELGFVYSTSVVAANNPLYGWPEFGPDRPCRRGGLWELPMSLPGVPGLNVPFMGGVYFRVLPYPLVRRWFLRRPAACGPIVGYLHPYDIDPDGERIQFPELKGNRLFNWLMTLNRGGVFERLEKLVETGVTIMPYAEYVQRYLEAGEPAGEEPRSAAAPSAPAVNR